MLRQTRTFAKENLAFAKQNLDFPKATQTFKKRQHVEGAAPPHPLMPPLLSRRRDLDTKGPAYADRSEGFSHIF